MAHTSKHIPAWMHVDAANTIAMLENVTDSLRTADCHLRAQLLVNLRSALDGAIAHAELERAADRDD